jgi:hypothetical protein
MARQLLQSALFSAPAPRGKVLDDSRCLTSKHFYLPARRLQQKQQRRNSHSFPSPLSPRLASPLATAAAGGSPLQRRTFRNPPGRHRVLFSQHIVVPSSSSAGAGVPQPTAAPSASFLDGCNESVDTNAPETERAPGSGHPSSSYAKATTTNADTEPRIALVSIVVVLVAAAFAVYSCSSAMLAAIQANPSTAVGSWRQGAHFPRFARLERPRIRFRVGACMRLLQPSSLTV